MTDNNRAQEELTLPPKTPGQHNKHATEDRLALFSERILDRADTLIYSLVGLLFLVGAFFALGYSIWNFADSMQTAINPPIATSIASPTPVSDSTATSVASPTPVSDHTANSAQNATSPTQISSGIAASIINFISDLLLVLIIMEVLSTVIHYLKSHATSLRPFLFIGIISAIRSVLSIGARLSVNGAQGGDFTNAMIELGVSAAVVLALGITLKLLGNIANIDSSGE